MSAPYPWLRLYTSTLDDSRVLAVATEVGIDEVEVLGRLCALMVWCSQHAQDGVIRAAGRATPALITERASRWHGPAGTLGAAFLSSGLLVEVEGGWRLADWEEQQGAHIAKLERDRAKRLPHGTLTGSSQNPHETRKGSARVPHGTLTQEGEGDREKEEAAVRARATIGNPNPPDRSLTDDERAVVTAWNAAAEANGRPGATTLPPAIRPHARRQIKTHGLADLKRAFELVCSYQRLWEPGSGKWVASLEWVLRRPESSQGPDVVERAKAGTYGPWVPVKQAQPEPVRDLPACIGCGKPAERWVWESSNPACSACEAQAVVSPEGARAWVEARRRGAA